jgi:hypothetical protein
MDLLLQFLIDVIIVEIALSYSFYQTNVLPTVPPTVPLEVVVPLEVEVGKTTSSETIAPTQKEIEVSPTHFVSAIYIAKNDLSLL